MVKPTEKGKGKLVQEPNLLVFWKIDSIPHKLDRFIAWTFYVALWYGLDYQKE